MRNTPDKSELFQKEIAQARKELQEGTIDKEQCEQACRQAYTRLNGPVPTGYDLVVHFQDDKVILGLGGAERGLVGHLHAFGCQVLAHGLRVVRHQAEVV